MSNNMAQRITYDGAKGYIFPKGVNKKSVSSQNYDNKWRCILQYLLLIILHNDVEYLWNPGYI